MKITDLNIEKVIKKSRDPLSKNDINRRLKRQIKGRTLNLILEYLEKGGKIAVLKEGIIWVYRENISKKLKNKLEKGVTIKNEDSFF